MVLSSHEAGVLGDEMVKLVPSMAFTKVKSHSQEGQDSSIKASTLLILDFIGTSLQPL